MAWQYDKEAAGISIHILHAEDDFCDGPVDCRSLISIHILHAEDDASSIKQDRDSGISIHILHAEDDHGLLETLTAGSNFNPHPPCGG